MRSLLRLSTLALASALITLPVLAQQQPAQKSPVTVTPSAGSATPHNWTTEQILTCTVSDCWQLAGRNESTFFDIIQQLSEISAEHRGLTLPDTEAAGRRTGEYIKAKARTDHGQLLYAIVDAAIRRSGTASTATK